jgi:hypothetical protein
MRILNPPLNNMDANVDTLSTPLGTQMWVQIGNNERVKELGHTPCLTTF